MHAGIVHHDDFVHTKRRRENLLDIGQEGVLACCLRFSPNNVEFLGARRSVCTMRMPSAQLATIRCLQMRESATQKCKALVYSLYLNTTAFCMLLFILRFFQGEFKFSPASIGAIFIIYYVATLIYYVYSVIHNFKAYFYAYALSGRKRSPLGAGLWFFIGGCLCVILGIGSWAVIVSFEGNVRAYLDHGAMRWLITTNVAAGLDVITIGIYGSCLLSACKRMQRVQFIGSS